LLSTFVLARDGHEWVASSPFAGELLRQRQADFIDTNRDGSRLFR
jgi:hypothetical protein